MFDLGLAPLGEAFRPTSEQYIRGVEELLGTPLPPVYRDFLARFGVATFRDAVATCLPDGTLLDVHVFLGNDPDDAYDLRQNIVALKEVCPGGLLPFAACPLGNLFSLARRDEGFAEVRFVDMHSDRTQWVAEGFAAFLAGLRRVP